MKHGQQGGSYCGKHTSHVGRCERRAPATPLFVARLLNWQGSDLSGRVLSLKTPDRSWLVGLLEREVRKRYLGWQLCSLVGAAGWLRPAFLVTKLLHHTTTRERQQPHLARHGANGSDELEVLLALRHGPQVRRQPLQPRLLARRKESQAWNNTKPIQQQRSKRQRV